MGPALNEQLARTAQYQALLVGLLILSLLLPGTA
jgi:1,4-dihydroxy-2-naphthoate polyprenyltransferase